MPVRKGYYRFSDTATDVYKCTGENCKGGSAVVGHASCKNNAKGPLCALCANDHFLGGDGSCKECSSSRVAASLAWVTTALIVLSVLAAAWRYGKSVGCFQNLRERVKTWVLERRVRFEWAGVALRILLTGSGEEGRLGG